MRLVLSLLFGAIVGISSATTSADEKPVWKSGGFNANSERDRYERSDKGRDYRRDSEWRDRHRDEGRDKHNHHKKSDRYDKQSDRYDRYQHNERSEQQRNDPTRNKIDTRFNSSIQDRLDKSSSRPQYDSRDRYQHDNRRDDRNYRERDRDYRDSRDRY